MSEKKQANPYGIFGEPSYISTDPIKEKSDPYEKEEPLMARYIGANFKTNPAKKGRQGDALFGGRKAKDHKDAPPVEDLYVMPGQRDPKKKKEHEESIKKIGGGKDFRFVSPAKRAVGLGSYYGTIAGKAYEHEEPEYKVRQKDEVPEKPKMQKKNIMTRPAKKGTYGTQGQFFSATATEMDKEGKPITDNYEAARIKEREAWKAAKKIQHDFIPASFKSTCRAVTYFDEDHNSGVSKIYAYPRPEPVPEKEKKEGKEGEAKPVEQKPFKYSSPPKKGWKGTLSLFPNAVEVDTKLIKDNASRAPKEKFKPSKGYLEGEWKPVSSVKTGLTRSLLRKFY